ncbi:MAG: excisionase family DNA-binding protein [Desulfobaccales bacterium]
MTDFISIKNLSTFSPEYFSLSGLAVYASVSRNTLKKWLHDFNMPHYRIGRCIRVRRSEFDVWVKQFRNGTSTDLNAIWDQVMKEV